MTDTRLFFNLCSELSVFLIGFFEDSSHPGHVFLECFVLLLEHRGIVIFDLHNVVGKHIDDLEELFVVWVSGQGLRHQQHLVT